MCHYVFFSGKIMYTEFLVRIYDEDTDSEEKRKHFVQYLRFLNIEFARVDSDFDISDSIEDAGAEIVWDKDVPSNTYHSDEDVKRDKDNRILNDIVDDVKDAISSSGCKWEITTPGKKISLSPLSEPTGHIAKYRRGTENDDYSIDVCKSGPHILINCNQLDDSLYNRIIQAIRQLL